MGVSRKLEDVHRDLTLLAEQGKIKGFFHNTENVNKLGGIVEDIRDAMMEYQVCIQKLFIRAPITFATDLLTARYLLQELSTHRESRSLDFELAYLPMKRNQQISSF